MGICDTDLLICNKTSLIISTAAHPSSLERGFITLDVPNGSKKLTGSFCSPTAPPLLSASPLPPSLATPLLWCPEASCTHKQNYCLSLFLSCFLCARLHSSVTHPKETLAFLTLNLVQYWVSTAQPSSRFLPDGFLIPGLDKPLWTLVDE